MSASHWDWSLASADDLLTNEECSLLLDVDILNSDDDLFKRLPTNECKLQYHDDATTSLYPPSPLDTKPSPAKLESDLLLQLENQCKQENIFSNWLEEKVELPVFENVAQVPERVVITPTAVAYQAPQPTEELLREFETVYGAVELTHLTPPQSPPGPATQLLLSYAQQAVTLSPPLPQPQPQWPQPDYELQTVDELVRERAAQLTSPVPSGSNSSAPSSPRSSTDDDSPRYKPYAVDDSRRSRKKEQNKNAATRYRQKKKAEIEVLLTEESALRQRHGELGDKCADLQREIRYLKGLMRELFRAKGLIK